MAIRNAEQEMLFRIGPGTPSGEVFRRYWLPVETSANLGGGRGPVVPSAKNPIRVKVLGEHLVLYRDAPVSLGSSASIAPTAARPSTTAVSKTTACAASITGGNTTARALPRNARGAAGQQLPTHGAASRVPMYEEVGGLIFAYMGPPDKQPPFPRYPMLFRDDGIVRSRAREIGSRTRMCSCRRWITCSTSGTARSPTAGTGRPGAHPRHPPRARRAAADADQVRAYAVGRLLRRPLQNTRRAGRLRVSRDACRVSVPAVGSDRRVQHELGRADRRLPHALVRGLVPSLRRERQAVTSPRTRG